jgi:16S rRNA C967 or C1407 C5-methylase (RsmB/RsmF family)/transcription termination factor NusB
LKMTAMRHFQSAVSVLAHRLPHSAKPPARISPQRGMTMSVLNERMIALDILTGRERTGRYSSALLNHTLDRYDRLTQSQRSFIKRLTEGTIERQIELDHIIRTHVRNPEMKMKPIVLCMLRMSIYQIFYMDSVPDFAAVNEALTILKNNHQEQAVGFVNAVLRSICRDKAGIKSAGGAGHVIIVSQGRAPAKAIKSETILKEEISGMSQQQTSQARETTIAAGPDGSVTGQQTSSDRDATIAAGPDGSVTGQQTSSDRDATIAAGPDRKMTEAREPAQHAAAGTKKVVRRIVRRVVTAQKPEDLSRLSVDELSVRFSMPKPIIGLWMDDYGRKRTLEMLPAFMEVRPVTIRVNGGLSAEEKDKLLSDLRAAGCEVTPGRYLPDCWHLRRAGRITDLPGFADGLFTVQDESSQMVAFAAGLLSSEDLDTAKKDFSEEHLGASRDQGASHDQSASKDQGASAGRTDSAEQSFFRSDFKTDFRTEKSLRTGLTVLDLCAAPGGKTMHAAEALCVKKTNMESGDMYAAQADTDGTVTSCDISAAKTDLIRENIRRMHLSNVQVMENDATEYREEWADKFDVVLCDVPCTGLGVMTHKRDIKYNFSIREMRSLSAVQRRILQNAVRYVKPGGVLIYSTCTIDKTENDRQTKYAANELGLIPDDLATHLPAGIPGIEGNHLQLFPDIHGTDGFFLARFRRSLKS